MEQGQLYTGPRGAPLPRTRGLRLTPGVLVPGLLVGLVVVAMLLVGDQPLRSIPLPLWALVPSVAAGAWLCVRRPVAITVAVFALIGAAGALRAFTAIRPEPIAEVLLAGLWIGLLLGFAGTSQPRRIWLWPALIAPALYLTLTALQTLIAPEVTPAIDSFRAGGWYLLACLLVAFAPWPLPAYRRLARGLVVVMVALGAYWVYRFLAGPAPEEIQVYQEALPGQRDIRFQGSLPAAPHLALWAVTTAPLALALGLRESPRWRLAAFAAFALACFGGLAAEVRTGIVALGLGAMTTLGVFLLARALPGGRRLASGLVVGMVVVAVGVGAYAVAIGGEPASEERFAGVFNPTGQSSFQARLNTWSIAMREVADEPLGIGIGTTGRAVSTTTFDPNIPLGIDSSYVKVAVEQGIPMMVLFIFALLALLAGLIVGGVTTRSPDAATFGAGAAGTLVALMVMLFSGYYIERPQALAAWIVIGIGAAHFTTIRGRDA